MEKMGHQQELMDPRNNKDKEEEREEDPGESNKNHTKQVKETLK